MHPKGLSLCVLLRGGPLQSRRTNASSNSSWRSERSISRRSTSCVGGVGRPRPFTMPRGNCGALSPNVMSQLRPSTPTPSHCNLTVRHKPCLLQHSDGLFYRWGSTDEVVHRTNLAEYPSLAEQLEPHGMQTVIDAGANEGSSVWLFACAFPKATVIGVEPSILNYAVASLNTQGVSNVLMLRAALWNRKASVRMSSTELGEWAWRVAEERRLWIPSESSASGSSHSAAERLPSVTVDDLLRLACATRIDFLKMDIEGAEAAVLAKSPAWLWNVRFVYLELHPGFALHAMPLALRALLLANMTVVAMPNMPHAVSRGWHEWIFLACDRHTPQSSCLALCKGWRRQTSIRCSRVRHEQDYWGHPHSSEDCAMEPLGLPPSRQAAKALCRRTAVD